MTSKLRSIGASCVFGTNSRKTLRLTLWPLSAMRRRRWRTLAPAAWCLSESNRKICNCWSGKLKPRPAQRRLANSWLVVSFQPHAINWSSAKNARDFLWKNIAKSVCCFTLNYLSAVESLFCNRNWRLWRFKKYCFNRVWNLQIIVNDSGHEQHHVINSLFQIGTQDKDEIIFCANVVFSWLQRRL